MEAKLDAKGIIPLFKDTFAEWNEDKVPRLAAAMAYYTAFSIAPLLLIAISVASIFYGNASAAARAQIAALIPGGGDAVTGLLDSANRGGKSGIAALVGFVTLLLGAVGLFGQLQDALNTIWEVQPKPNQGFMAMVKARFFSLTMVLGTGFLLLVSLLASSALTAVTGYFQNLLPGADIVWTILSYVISIVLTTVIFALIFKVIPDVDIAWGDVWIGAGVTSVLFFVGQLALNLYLSTQTDAYGAFGSLLVLLLWVFYSAQILFFGAEFTQMYARRYGSQIKPSAHAMPVSEVSRENQGLPRTGNTTDEGTHEREVGGTTRSVPAHVSIVTPSEGPKPGVVTTAVGFAIGWLLGRNEKAKR